MDFDNRKIYGDTSITDGLVLIKLEQKKGLLNCLMLENIDVQLCFNISISNFASKSDFAGCFTSPLFLLLPKVITWKARGVF